VYKSNSLFGLLKMWMLFVFAFFSIFLKPLSARLFITSHHSPVCIEIFERKYILHMFTSLPRAYVINSHRDLFTSKKKKRECLSSSSSSSGSDKNDVLEVGKQRRICPVCKNSGMKPCGQCEGTGINTEDRYGGREGYRKGERCWLCSGKKRTICGNCIDLTDSF